MAKNKKGVGNKSAAKNSVNLEVSCNPALNPEFLSNELKSNFLSAYKSKSAFGKEGVVKLHNEPFQCCEMFNFIDGDDFLQEMHKELKGMQFYKKNNDLYKFKQSNDFKKLKLPYAQAIRKFLLKDFRSWVSECTGIELLDAIDLTSSEYSYTDVLLCHDDELDSRRIAFTLYFVDPQWSKEDGGSLDLFGCDEWFEPTRVVSSIHPIWNKLAWFEVSEYSHHQVSEVLCKEKSRPSIHGWFHSKPVPRPARFIEPNPEVMTFVEVEESVLRDWINPIYLERVTHASIRLKFEKRSEIELPDFFKEEKYNALVESFTSKDLQWKPRGPPNKRNFESLDVNLENKSETPSTGSEEVIRQCLQILASEAMFLILSNMTGLRFHKLVPKSNEDEENDDDDDESEVSEDGDEGDDVANQEEDNDNDDDGGDVSRAKEESIEEVEKDLKRKRSLSGGEHSGLNIASELEKPESKKMKHDDDGDDNDAPKPGSSDAEPEPCNAKCCFEVRKWSHGSYATANHKILSSSALDAVMAFNIDDWKSQYGGFTSYIAKDEDQELLTIEPKKNSLNLVYREEEVLSFVKHVNHKVATIPDQSKKSFFDLSFSYFE